ncbi:MAG: phosphotransferase [Clostridiales bacterium]|nr:phosphotransferase [Clostridiales bacterium]
MTNIIQYLKDKFTLSEVNEVQVKNGVHVYEVLKEGKKYYLKYFEKKSDAKEILCYQALLRTEIPIIKFYETTENSILLEDMTINHEYRIGCEDDFRNPKAIKSVAKWFKQLHALSYDKTVNFDFLSEDDVEFKQDEITLCYEQYGNDDFFNLLLSVRIQFNDYLKKSDKILSHGDFYYKNFFVNRTDNEVVMFDFNYMKKGLLSEELSLIRRNLRNRSKESEEVFIKEYGDYDEVEYEIYSIYRHVSCLLGALSIENFPNWAVESKELLDAGILSRNLISTKSKINS